MDIDNPDASTEGLVSSFSAVFPIPFRVLSLVGLGGLCWAINLHILDWLGVDSAQALQIPPHKALGALPSHGPPYLPPGSPHSGPSPSTLYRPLYRIVGMYISFVACGWFLFYLLTQGGISSLNATKWVPAICFTVILLAIVLPLRDMYGAQRSCLYQSLYRCVLSTSDEPVHFCDVITADILTSFAKVLGDIWISLVILLPGGSLEMTFTGDRLSDLAVPLLLSVPYAIRFRQCVVEYLGSGGKSQRPMYNAVKYATAFPVIFLSAAQRLVNVSSEHVEKTWYGEFAVFRLWLLAVFVNSAYSFWWDVTNDWGLTLLKTQSWSKGGDISATYSYQPLPHSAFSRRSSAGLASSHVSVSFAKTHSRKQSSFSALPLSPLTLTSTPFPVDTGHSTVAASHPFGLRSPLLFRDSIVYYIAVLLNFVLRFTWSLKLSSHLHTVAELESGVFLMEALELIRRWMWVFFRVEWEAVKKMQERELEQLSLMQSVRPGNGHSGRRENIKLFDFQEEESLSPQSADGRMAN